MAGLDPAISSRTGAGWDGRVKPGHDGLNAARGRWLREIKHASAHPEHIAAALEQVRLLTAKAA
jgi:hypothetical protein